MIDLTEEPDEEVTRRIQEMFGADEAVLRAALDRARGGFDHRGLRGDSLERGFRAFLGARLPLRYASARAK
jgi:hypothetical protein